MINAYKINHTYGLYYCNPMKASEWGIVFKFVCLSVCPCALFENSTSDHAFIFIPLGVYPWLANPDFCVCFFIPVTL